MTHLARRSRLITRPEATRDPVASELPASDRPSPHSQTVAPSVAPVSKFRWPLYLGIGTALVAASLLASQVSREPDPVAQAPANRPGPIAVVGLGYIEPVTTVVKLGAPGNPDSQRIHALKVDEGDEVAEGQVLAILDTAARLESQVKAAQTQVDLKRIQLDRQKLEIVATITARRSSLDRARAELSMTRAEFERQKTLRERGYATEATFEKKQREMIASEATVRETEAMLERIEASVHSSGPENSTLIDVAVTEKELASAEAELDVAKANLEQAFIRAPFMGRILTLRTRTGERIGTDGLLDLGATRSMRAVIEVYQTDLPRVRIGQSVTLKSDVLPQPISGRVDRVGSTVKRQSVVNNDPATATDARIIEVFIGLDEASSLLVAELSNLQVYGVFEP